MGANRTLGSLLFSIMGSFKFTLAPGCSDRVGFDLCSAIRLADSAAPWKYTDAPYEQLSRVPSIGSLTPEKLIADGKHAICIVKISPFLPLKFSQMQAYYRYLETIAERTLQIATERRVNLDKKVLSVSIALEAHSCSSDKIYAGKRVQGTIDLLPSEVTGPIVDLGRT